MAKIFISYRRDDARHPTGRLSDALKREFGDGEVFLDLGSIRAADDFQERIESSLAACSVLLAVIGPQWLDARHENGHRRLDSEDDFVRLELAKALGRRIAVIPVLLDDTEMPAPDKLPQDLKPLARRNAVKLVHEYWDEGMKALVSQIHRLLLKEKEDAYRAALDEAWRDGAVSEMERKTLLGKRNQLGLTEEQADAIEQPMRLAMEDRRRRLSEYRDDVAQILDKGYPPSKQQRADMENRRDALALSDEEAQRIDKEQLIAAEQRHRDRPRQAAATEPAASAAEPATAPSPPSRPPTAVHLPSAMPAAAPVSAPAAQAPSAALDAAKAVAGGAATVVAGTAFLAMDGVAGLLRLFLWLLTTMLPGALVLLGCLAVGPLEPFWMPGAIYGWLPTGEGGSLLAVVIAIAVLVAGATWYFVTEASVSSPGEVLLPAAFAALVTGAILYSLGGQSSAGDWDTVVLLGTAVHWVTVWVCTIFDL